MPLEQPSHDQPVGPIGVDEFNALPDSAALALLRPCLDVPRWAEDILTQRPFGSAEDLYDAAAHAANPLTEAEVTAALAHHPRIGEKAAGAGATAEMSRREQETIAAADGPAGGAAQIQADIAAGNEKYERKFGQVFLIRAAGRSSREILANLQERLEHTPEQEAPIVAEQLHQIAQLRLGTLVVSGQNTEVTA